MGSSGPSAEGSFLARFEATGYSQPFEMQQCPLNPGGVRGAHPTRGVIMPLMPHAQTQKSRPQCGAGRREGPTGPGSPPRSPALAPQPRAPAPGAPRVLVTAPAGDIGFCTEGARFCELRT